MSLRPTEVLAPRRRRGQPERAVQRAILAYLRARGCLVAVTDAGAPYRAGAFGADTVPAGWPDITGLLPDGRFLGVECKAPGGRQSPAQRQMEQEIRRRNGLYVLARSIDDVRRALPRAPTATAGSVHVPDEVGPDRLGHRSPHDGLVPGLSERREGASGRDLDGEPQ